MESYKLLPSEPTEQMIANTLAIDSVHFNIDIDRAMLIKLYKAMWKAAPDIKQEPVRYEIRIRSLPDGPFTDWSYCSKEIYESFKENPIKDTYEYEVRALYTHPQSNHNVMQPTWIKFDINDESTYPPLESGSGMHSIRVITNGGDICQFIHTNKQWVYLLNYEIAPVTHWAKLPVYIK
jgi:hypothetical protein